MTETIPAEVLSAMGDAYDMFRGPRDGESVEDWQKAVGAAALKAAEAAGYALVPMEPDDAAVDTFADTYFTIGISGDWRRRSPNENHLKQMRELIRDGLRAMIAARPKVP